MMPWRPLSEMTLGELHYECHVLREQVETYLAVHVGSDAGPPVTSCLLCGCLRPLAVWYAGTRVGVCDVCRAKVSNHTDKEQAALVAPWCPLCHQTLTYQGWQNYEQHSTWACAKCLHTIQIQPYIPSKERKALVPSLSQVDSAQRMVEEQAALVALVEEMHRHVTGAIVAHHDEAEISIPARIVGVWVTQFDDILKIGPRHQLADALRAPRPQTHE